MKLIKQIALSILLVLGISGIVIYTSCTKDACKTVNCLNGGICSGGSCNCVDSGTGGTNCQIVYRQLYNNTYLGNAIISYSPLDSAAIDSGYANHTDDSNTLVFQKGSDSALAPMQLTWKDGKNVMLTPPITLINNTATGATFLIPPTTGGPHGAYSIRGSGSVSATNASVNLVGVPAHSTTPTISVTLSNCIKQ